MLRLYSELYLSLCHCEQCLLRSGRDVDIGFLGKPVISFGKPVLNRLLVLLIHIKIVL